MVITTTAVAFISLSLGLTICGLWFLKAFRAAGGIGGDKKIGFLLSSLFLAFGFNNGFIGMGTLLFARNTEALFFVFLTSHFFLTLIALLGVYAAYYIFSPRLSPYLGMALVGILGATTVITTVITHPQPYISSQNGIELGYNFSLSLLVFYLLFISIGSLLYIFVRLFLSAKTSQVKLLSLLNSVLALAGILLAFIRLILLYNSDVATRVRIYDYGIVSVGIMFIVVLSIAPIIKNLIAVRKLKILPDPKKHKIES